MIKSAKTYQRRKILWFNNIYNKKKKRTTFNFNWEG